jgi:Tol biopolymer transport system component
VKTLAAAIAATMVASGASHRSAPPLIVFAADRAPTVTGDIYRVDASGRVANLTHSPWQETTPVVSPNGKVVAFVSDRSGGGVWTIGVDGSGLRHASAQGFPSEYAVEIAWAPDSRTLAYTTGGAVSNRVTLWLAGSGRPARAMARAETLFRPAWSPDGRLVTVATDGAVDAYTPSGRRVWNVSSAGQPVGWSTTGLFATGPYDGRIHVVDERGAERFSVAATFAAWSPDGKRIATVHGRRGEVRTSSGRLISSKRLATPFDIVPVWASSTRVAFDNAPSVGPNTIRTGSTFAVRLGTHVYTHVHGCDDDGGPVAAIQSLQAVPRSTSLVYQSYCAEPFHNLYAISPDGTGLRRITNVQADQVQPRLSPDRTRIAFAESQYAGLSCKGCPQALRTIGVDGTGAATLTTPPDCTFDDSPAWSPDGAQLAFSHSGCDSAPDVQVIAAGGGTPADLHAPGYLVAWGPDRIAYVNGRTAPTSVWTMSPDGTNRVKVGSGNAAIAAWSSDGRLAYLVGTTGVVQGREVPLPFARLMSLAWSPDGTRFLVTAKAQNTPAFDLYTVRIDGTGVRRLTTNLDVSGGDWR